MHLGVNRVRRLIKEKTWDLSIDARIERNRYEIIRLAKSNISFREIAKILRIPRNEVYKILISEGINFIR